MIAVPKIGDDIYVPTSLYIGHGEDDVRGGLAKVKSISENISAGQSTPFIEVYEHPGVSYNWELLYKRQDELKERFGNNRAYEDPD
jgi:hypothetical protein